MIQGFTHVVTWFLTPKVVEIRDFLQRGKCTSLVCLFSPFHNHFWRTKYATFNGHIYPKLIKLGVFTPKICNFSIFHVFDHLTDRVHDAKYLQIRYFLQRGKCTSLVCLFLPFDDPIMTPFWVHNYDHFRPFLGLKWRKKGYFTLFYAIFSHF